ncbi:MAG: hypothetical protein JO339_39675 [Alphaproteobacteria bacterium]|nr:hypothetical protein [Alphaproteobacteria bacterium]
MSIAAQARDAARLQAGEGTAEQKVRIAAWDRLRGLLSALDSKTSVLLRFNAIVVAALAYLVIVSAVDPFSGARPVVKLLGSIVGHVSLAISVLSCGFAFPVIYVEREVYGLGGSDTAISDRSLERLGDLVSRHARYYAWAWHRLRPPGSAGRPALTVGRDG